MGSSTWRALVVTLGLGLATLPGCSSHSPFHRGSLRCSCAGTDCPCLERHRNGDLECRCEPADVYGGKTNVGEPDDH